jgi:hypothetical protein
VPSHHLPEEEANDEPNGDTVTIPRIGKTLKFLIHGYDYRITFFSPEYESLLRSVQNSRKNLVKQTGQHKLKSKALQSKIKELETVVESQLNELEELRVVKSSVEKIFSKKQLQLLTGTSNRVHWSESDIGRCVSLQATSSKAYSYLRKCWNLPLPAASTLYYWLNKMEIQPDYYPSRLSTSSEALAQPLD